MEFLDITPSYPLRDLENWRVLEAVMESGAEERLARWSFPKREWDVVWRRIDKETEVQPIRNLLHRCRGGADSFYFKEPYPTSRIGIYMCTGSRAAAVFPVWAPASISVFVNSVWWRVGSQYTVNSYGGVNSHHIINVTGGFEPAAGVVMHGEYTSGFYTPIVRQVGGGIPHALVPPGWIYGEMAVTLRETREDVPAT